MNKDLKIYLILIVIIILIILGIFYIKSFFKEAPQEKLIRCIAANSSLYVYAGCSHCETQKQILKDYISYFKINDCLKSPEICQESGITAYPTWIIAGKSYEGVQSIKKLTELTGCQSCDINETITNDTGTCAANSSCIQPVTSVCSVGDN